MKLTKTECQECVYLPVKRIFAMIISKEHYYERLFLLLEVALDPRPIIHQIDPALVLANFANSHL